MSSRLACLLLLCAGFFWGAGNVANKTVLDHLGPLSVLCLRTLFAAALILPLTAFEQRRQDKPGWRKSAALVSVLLVFAMVFQQVAYISTTVINVSFLVNVASILTPLLAWAWLGQRPSARIFLAAAVTFVGAFLMAGQVSLLRPNAGDLFCLVSALFYGAWMVALGQHAVAFGRPMATCLLQFFLTALVTGPCALLIEQPSIVQIRQALPEIAFIAIFPTSAGFLLQTTAQRYVSAPVAAVLVSTESLFGGALAWLLLGEGLTPAGLVGCCLIFGGVMLAATTNTPPAMPPMTLPPSRARPSKVPITKIPITKIPVTLTG